MSSSPILQVTNLKKTFTSKKISVEAVKGVNLNIEQGETFGFLGPNGAGKTTTLKMLTTLLAPTSGEAKIVGFDLLKEPEKVREQIGYVSQAGGSDTTSTAYENLVLQAELYHIDKKTAQKRAQALIDYFSMNDFANRIVASYSGGQKRRLELALGIVHEPQLVFLDEPTLGLDPQSRANFWEKIRQIRSEGTTIFLTTHYLDEADLLCDHLAIIDDGLIVTEGTPLQLKKEIADESIVLGFELMENLKRGQEIFDGKSFIDKILVQDNNLHLYVKESEKLLAEVIRLLDENKISVQTIELAKPSLDDVFLQKTGRSLRENNEG